MALQQCRPGLARSRDAARCISSCVARRCFASDAATPESFKLPESQADHQPAKPRWSQTPPAMKAALQMDFAKKPANKIWFVNNNPEKLDDMYNRLLGPGGSRLLPEELKWLAVTHKSFDQGRRGFNDRLALMGMSRAPPDLAGRDDLGRPTSWGEEETELTVGLVQAD